MGKGQDGGTKGHARCESGEITISPSSGLSQAENSILLIQG